MTLDSRPVKLILWTLWATTVLYTISFVSKLLNARDDLAVFAGGLLAGTMLWLLWKAAGAIWMMK
jgi:hypothetical protein